MKCSVSEYALYKIMQSINNCCQATKECDSAPWVHAGVKCCHGNTIHNLVTSTCVFVANKAFEYIFAKCNNYNRSIGILFHKKGKLDQFRENFTHKNTPPIDNGSFQNKKLSHKYHILCLFHCVITFNI